MAEASFKSDPRVTEIAEAYAVDAVDLASRNFGVTLQWSEDSVCQVEEMLGRLHDKMAHAEPPPDAAQTFAKAFGSYVGEVLRRHHGGEWGIVRMGEKRFPGLQLAHGALRWPWGRVHDRLINGPEDNVWHCYNTLVREPG